ncbi:CheY-P-specific phosphatase CheC [Alicyclobacillus hesperidum]|uniref:CheY-P-specific phosphatase CheC n=1 Tax=Alicyclobacillus hesperidum TaxID=89784 RepID=A0AA37X6B0_9BACL|nr:chemotaxis protein CheC [Alicyclobacillus hesperidum]GLV12384.1 CheY-P-specific phosphatase CheC [Alicyclobacillus hesperidum]
MRRLQVDPVTLDALREFGNIGAGHAATALSTLLGGRVKMSVTDARLCPFSEIVDVVGGGETIVAAVFIRIFGTISGNMFVLMSLPSADRLLERLLPAPRKAQEYTELEQSAIAEVGNILSGAYVAAISDLCGISLNQSIPAVAIDMAAALLDIGLMMSGDEENQAILISTSLVHDGNNIDAYFFLLPDLDGTEVLLDILRGKIRHG